VKKIRVTWTGEFAPEAFRKAALAKLEISRANRDECAKLRRDVKGECYAIQVRSVRARAWRGPIFRAAGDLARDMYRSFQWAQAVSQPLEEIAREIELRGQFEDRS
jgi:hypothetical protein